VSSLLVTHGHHFGVRYELLAQTSIGRSSSCTIQLLDEKASRLHASILRDDDGQFVLRDEGSSNGTGLNGRLLLEPKQLEPGDELAIGNNLLLFEPDLEILRDLEGAGSVVLTSPTADTVSARLLAAAGSRAPAFRVEGLIAEIADMLSGPRGVGRPAALVEAVVRGLAADRGALLLAPTGGEPMKAVATYPHRSRVTINRELILQVLDSREPVLADQGIADLTVREGRSLIEARGGTALVVPISRGGRVRGVFYADAALGDGFRGLPLGVLQSVVAMAFAPILTGDPQDLRPALPEGDTRRPIARSPASQRVLERGRLLSEDPYPLLLVGEPGSGKSFLAHHIHRLSPRAAGPFVSVKCGALAEGAAEVVLFGKEGSSGDDADRTPGLIEKADGGTLLLDEVSELSPALQVKLLRLLQEGRFYRSRGTRPIRADVRLLAGAHRDLAKLVETGVFLGDLYERLNVTRVDLPALRERLADIEPLVRSFTRDFNTRTGAAMKGFTAEAVGLLESAAWPGNLRELRTVVERLLICAPAAIVIAQEVEDELVALPWATDRDPDRSLGVDITGLERKVTIRALARARGSRARAAALLGVTRSDLDRRIAQYKVDDFGR
jgi:DNA-binding NtrC family response regulator/pSer/pThr/pTyr-binding forkhead associated (FHA) protein